MAGSRPEADRPNTARRTVTTQLIIVERDPAAVFALTRRLATALAGEPPRLVAIALKLTSELADLAVSQPARGELGLVVESSAETVRVELRCDPPAIVVEPSNDRAARLFLSRLANRWGTLPGDRGIWFALDRERRV